MTTPFEREASRRKFLAFLAASPFAAYGATDGFAQGVAMEPRPKVADPIMWAPHDPSALITDPKQALKVLAFEPISGLTEARIIETRCPTVYVRSCWVQIAEVVVGLPDPFAARARRMGLDQPSVPLDSGRSLRNHQN